MNFSEKKGFNSVTNVEDIVLLEVFAYKLLNKTKFKSYLKEDSLAF